MEIHGIHSQRIWTCLLGCISLLLSAAAAYPDSLTMEIWKSMESNAQLNSQKFLTPLVGSVRKPQPRPAAGRDGISDSPIAHDPAGPQYDNTGKMSPMQRRSFGASLLTGASLTVALTANAAEGA